MNCYYPFKGLGVALVTPFRQDGRIDYDSLSGIVENLIEGGTDFLCVLGTTAETPTLTSEERLSLTKFVIKAVDGRIPVMVGCSSNSTAIAVEQVRNYQMDGIDGILSVVPYYNKPSQEGIYCHFREIARASGKPIILYNVPGRTGVNMTVETTLRIARDFPNVIGIKEASGNLEQIERTVSGAPDTFRVIVGDDSLAQEAIRRGAAGVISVIGNAIPKTFGKLVHLSMEGRFDEASVIQRRLEPLYGLMFKEGNPCGVKALMTDRKMLENVMRLPLVPISESLHREILQRFEGIE